MTGCSYIYDTYFWPVADRHHGEGCSGGGIDFQRGFRRSNCRYVPVVVSGERTENVYDPHDKTIVMQKTLSVSEISGEDYRWIELDAVPLKPEHGQYLWFAPPKRPDEINAVYIDRIVVMRE
ncbi:MAG: hypothetical protein LBS03_11525 [Bacteroidales bacterium]|jgi:hypothetical protein|nr:hypothetical protein [Bacteroidales bacterium]